MPSQLGYTGGLLGMFKGNSSESKPFKGEPTRESLTEPPPGRRGGATFGTLYPTPGSLVVAGITSASPATLEVGSSNNAVTLTGFGFASGDSVSAVEWDATTAAWVADSLITVDTVVWVSSTSMTCQIDVSASAPVGHPINLRIVR